MIADRALVKSATSLLMLNEGYRGHPYKDARGITTIGYGRNLESVGISQAEALVMLANDVADAVRSLNNLSFFPALDHNRKVVVVDMVVNLGFKGFLDFTDLCLALQRGDFAAAANAMMDSVAAKEAPARWYRNARVMRTGEM